MAPNDFMVITIRSEMAFSKAIVKFLSKSGFGHSYNFVDFVKTA
jgi:hypothetical protein